MGLFEPLAKVAGGLDSVVRLHRRWTDASGQSRAQMALTGTSGWMRVRVPHGSPFDFRRACSGSPRRRGGESAGRKPAQRLLRISTRALRLRSDAPERRNDDRACSFCSWWLTRRARKSPRVRRSFNSRAPCEGRFFDFTLRDARRKDIRSLQSDAVDSEASGTNNATNGKRQQVRSWEGPEI